MIDLGFEIVRTPYDARSGLSGTVVQKRRADGRIGAAVGDEALLWDALQEAKAVIDELKTQLELSQKGRKR